MASILPIVSLALEDVGVSTDLLFVQPIVALPFTFCLSLWRVQVCDKVSYRRAFG